MSQIHLSTRYSAYPIEQDDVLLAFSEWASRPDNPICTMRDDDHPLPVAFAAGAKWQARRASAAVAGDEQYYEHWKGGYTDGFEDAKERLQQNAAVAGEAVAYVRADELEKLKDPRVAGRGMMLHKEQGHGMVAVYLAPQPPSSAQAKHISILADEVTKLEIQLTSAWHKSQVIEQQARDQALEDAAKVAEQTEFEGQYCTTEDCKAAAVAIRALKGKSC